MEHDRLFNPDNFGKDAEEYTGELLPGQQYRPDDEKTFDYGKLQGMTNEQLTEKGPEEFVRILAQELERKQRLDEMRRNETVEHLGILPEDRKKYYDSQSHSLEIVRLKATLSYFRTKMPDRLDSALEASGLDPEIIK